LIWVKLRARAVRAGADAKNMIRVKEIAGPPG